MNNWGSYCSCSSVCREHCLSVDNSFLGILAEGIFHVFQGYLPLEPMSVQKNTTEDRFKQNAVFSFFFPLQRIFYKKVHFFTPFLTPFFTPLLWTIVVPVFIIMGDYVIFENLNQRYIFLPNIHLTDGIFFGQCFASLLFTMCQVDFSASWKPSLEIVSPGKCTIKHSEA